MPNLGRVIARPVIVRSRTGDDVEVAQWICPCGSEHWIVFTIDGSNGDQHNHLRCAVCGEVFCDRHGELGAEYHQVYCDGTCGA